MEIFRNPFQRLRAVLCLVALHSLAVSIGLILHPDNILQQAGYQPVNESFFPIQGGVFHLIMAMAYSLAALDPRAQRPLVVFAVLVKIVATVFLLSYWLFVDKIIAVLGSGLVDGIMAIVIWTAYRSWLRTTVKEVA